MIKVDKLFSAIVEVFADDYKDFISKYTWAVTTSEKNIKLKFISLYNNDFSFITLPKLNQLSKVLNTSDIRIGIVEYVHYCLSTAACPNTIVSEYELTIVIENYKFPCQ